MPSGSDEHPRPTYVPRQQAAFSRVSQLRSVYALAVSTGKVTFCHAALYIAAHVAAFVERGRKLEQDRFSAPLGLVLTIISHVFANSNISLEEIGKCNALARILCCMKLDQFFDEMWPIESWGSPLSRIRSCLRRPLTVGSRFRGRPARVQGVPATGGHAPLMCQATSNGHRAPAPSPKSKELPEAALKAASHLVRKERPRQNICARQVFGVLGSRL